MSPTELYVRRSHFVEKLRTLKGRVHLLARNPLIWNLKTLNIGSSRERKQITCFEIDLVQLEDDPSKELYPNSHLKMRPT